MPEPLTIIKWVVEIFAIYFIVYHAFMYYTRWLAKNGYLKDEDAAS